MIAKFLSVDPLSPKYPELTPYQFAGNTPIQAIDLDGLEPLNINNPYQGMKADAPLVKDGKPQCCQQYSWVYLNDKWESLKNSQEFVFIAKRNLQGNQNGISTRNRRFLDKVYDREGRTFEDRSGDKGGPTKFGIATKGSWTEEAAPFLGKEANLYNLKILEQGDADKFYISKRIEPLGIDKIRDERVAYGIFDQAVKAPNLAKQLVRKTLNDGFGYSFMDKTGYKNITQEEINAINKIDPDKFLDKFLNLEKDYYNDRVKKDPNDSQYLNGWLNRLDSIRAYKTPGGA